MHKPKLSAESVKIIVVLTVIALVAGLIIGVMNMVTYVSDEVQTQRSLEKVYPEAAIVETIEIAGYENLTDTEIKAAFKASDGAYIILSHSKKAYNSNGIDLYIVIKDGEIFRIDGSGNSETPGLGSKALTQNYLKTYYVGKTAEDFTDEDVSIADEDFIVSWDLENDFTTSSGTSGGVAAVSGATKSSKGVYAAVTAALRFYEKIKGGENEA